MSTKRDVVVITGTSKGLGKELALEFIKTNKYTVIGCSRSKHEMSLLSKQHSNHDFTALDISDYNSVKNWGNRIMKEYGIPSIIINNAALSPNKNNFEKIPINEHISMINVNILGSINIIYSFLHEIKKNNKECKILNTTSIAGIGPFINGSHYAASKWAIEGLTKSIAHELPNNIMMCTFDPGCIATDGFQQGESLTYEQAIRLGALIPNQWAKENVKFIVNMKRNEYNGNHVFAKGGLESYKAYFGEEKVKEIILARSKL